MTIPSEQQIPQQLASASIQWTKLRRACGVGMFDAWSLAIFAALSLPCVGFSDVSGPLIAVALGTGAAFEFVGVAQLRRLHPKAPKRLAINQAGIAAALVLYGLWNMYQTSQGKGLVASFASEKSEIRQQLGPGSQDIQDMAAAIGYVLYGLLIVGAVCFQGGLALYYFSREKHLQRYVSTTPTWILEMQQSMGKLTL